MIPNILQVREAIEKAETEQLQAAFKTLYLSCSRVGEIASEKTPGDKTAHPTGYALSARVENYKPNIRNPREREALILNSAAKGEKYNPVECSKFRTPVLILSVLVEKRDYQKMEDGSIAHAWIKECAIPLDPIYRDGEWAQEILKYFEKQPKDKPLFPLNRHDLWIEAKKIFHGFKYVIQPYRRAIKINGEFQYSDPDERGRRKLKTELIPEKEKAANAHSTRHWRKEELENEFGFSDPELNAFGGWTAGAGANRASQRYSKLPWRIYFPKLLIEES